MKLRKLHIEDYKMFKDFDISFVDENDEALPIIVLAGVNGSGKTSLLEYIYNFTYYLDYDNYDEIDIEKNKKDFIRFANFILALPEHELNKAKKELTDNIFYFLTDTDIENVKELIPEYLHKMVWDEDILASESFKRLREYIESLFIELNLDFEFASRDGKRNLFFRKKGSENKFSIDELSTGEKTLLSKVLYMYLADIKDKVILIDEPELSLHPSWQNRVLKIYEKFAKKNNCQIIIATHSPHIIASADNEYIRFLEKNEDGNISVINDIQAYGRDIEWVLQQMGVKNLRVSEVLEKFTNCQQLLNNEKYDEAEECINELEEEIGQNDRQIMNLRNSLFFERD